MNELTSGPHAHPTHVHSHPHVICHTVRPSGTSGAAPKPPLPHIPPPVASRASRHELRHLRLDPIAQPPPLLRFIRLARRLASLRLCSPRRARGGSWHHTRATLVSWSKLPPHIMPAIHQRAIRPRRAAVDCACAATRTRAQQWQISMGRCVGRVRVGVCVWRQQKPCGARTVRSCSDLTVRSQSARV